MVATAETVEWIEVRNEVEALMLEYSLIKQHRPRFNVRLRDDKSYPFLAVTLDEQWPRALVMRGRKRKGVRYFGPYAHAYAIRDTLDLLLRTFPIRTCCPGKFNQHQRLGRPCLLFHIEKCSGPCVGEIEEMPYRQLVDELCDFLDGDTDEIVERLDARHAAAATELEFERAARLRDRLTAVQRAIEKQQMVADRNEDIDVIGSPTTISRRPCRCSTSARAGSSAQGLHPRQGRGSHARELVDRILEEMYGDEPPLGVPKQVLVPIAPADVATYEEWLTHIRGSKVQIRVPQRGDKRDLLETVNRNAEEEFVRHRLRRASDHNSRSRALTELQDLLQLPEAPLRIECYDMAHLQGTDYVGSMVVLTDGLPDKREYRRFKVKGVPGNDDYAAMEEVLTRRLTAYLAERDSPLGEPGAGRASSPTRRSCCSSTAARASSPSPSGSCTSSASTTRSRSLAGEAVRRGVRAGQARADERAPGQRGAVHAPAHPGRGPPLRQHVPPRAAGQANDGQRARRHPRPRRVPAQEAGQALGGVNAVKRADPRRAAGAVVPARRGGGAIHTKFHADAAGRDRRRSDAEP